jgi:hypothetical protein
MANWIASTVSIISRCGFCDEWFDSWDARKEHLAKHFKEGKGMGDWKGDWGFTPDVLQMVEAGMPPYLIDNERTAPDPFSARNDCVLATDDAIKPYGETAESDYGQDIQTRMDKDGYRNPRYFLNDANCYRRLERRLAAYTQAKLAQGVKPSDEQLQEQARLIIFSCDGKSP